MKKILNHVLSGASLGICIGFLFALSFSFINQTSYFMPSTPEFVNHFASNTLATAVSALLWACMGIVFSVSPLVFGIEQWSITRQTIVHFVITFVFFTPLAILAGWFPLNTFWLIGYTLIFLAMYVLMWLIFMHRARKEINDLNKLLLKERNNSPQI